MAARISNAYASDFEPDEEDDDEEEESEDDDELEDELSDFFSACLASFLFAPDSAEAADREIALWFGS